MPPHAYLALAIVSEVIATALLKASEGFSRLWPTVGCVVGYLAAFYFLSVTLKTMPTGVVYAIWSGVGVVLISIVGWVVFKQPLDPPALFGMGLIVAGVIVINVFSNTVSH